MTKDEIKEKISIKSLLEEYGVKVNRQGMCCCPIHGEKRPSMKVYKDSYYCFACGRSGDIYSLVEALDGCDFKTAFIKLGGTYEKMTNREKKNSRVSWNHSKESKQINEIDKAEYEQVFWSCLDIIHYSNKLQPYSNTWCEIKNFEPLLKSWLDEYEDRREVNVNVYTKCCEFRQKFNFTRSNI